MSEEKIRCKDCSRDITNEGGVSVPTDNGMVCQNCRTNYECCRQINCNIRVSKGSRKYCDKHKKEMECSECRKEVEDVYYSITIGDKLERDYNEAKKFNLCQSHWQQNKESYKEQVSQGKIEVLKSFYSKDGSGFGAEWLTTCKTCQKWSDEYEGVKHGAIIDYTFCSANCQKQYDNLSFEEKQNLIQAKQLSSNSQIKQTQPNSPQEEITNQNKSNYLPWILGGVGVLGIIGIVVYFLTRKENK